MEKNNVQDITNKLWAMANELRGTMDAGEFKNYILAFMFYRYLSKHQEDYLVKNEILEVAEGKSVNDVYLSIPEDEVPEYLLDIASNLGYAIAPNDTWETLLAKIDNSEMQPSHYQALFDNFNTNAQINSEATEDFIGIFNDVNLGDSRLGSNTAIRAKSLGNIVKLVDSIEYKSEDGRDILGEIYEYLIGKFAASAGKKGGEFYTPHEVSMILAKITTLDFKDENTVFTVYDPTMGSGSLLLTVRNELPHGKNLGAVHFHGQELNTTTYNLARMNLMMHDVSFNSMDLHNADTLESDWPDGLDAKGIDHPRSFQAVVSNPPYSSKWDNNDTKLKDPRFKDYGKLAPASKADYAFILHGIYHLDNEGTMAIVLPHGVLFRGAAEGKIRQTILEKNYLHAVIGLPANLFYGTSIPTCILVFKKNKTTRDVLFIDASNDFEKGKNQNTLSEANIKKIVDTYKNRVDVEKYAHLATMEEIEENEYNLNIPRYVDTFEEEEEIDLDEINRLIDEDSKEIAKLEAELEAELAKLVRTDR